MLVITFGEPKIDDFDLEDFVEPGEEEYEDASLTSRFLILLLV